MKIKKKKLKNINKQLWILISYMIFVEGLTKDDMVLNYPELMNLANKLENKVNEN